MSVLTVADGLWLLMRFDVPYFVRSHRLTKRANDCCLAAAGTAHLTLPSV